jgi:RNA polymerase sigma-32 factor
MTTTSVKTIFESDVSRYFRKISKFPVLSREEELALARRWRDKGDEEAAHKLVTSHLRLVAKIATGYRGYGLPIGELISEGNMGMMQAAQRFDPERGFRLATYATWWIRAAIQEYVLRSWSLVKIATAGPQKSLFFNLRRLKSEMRVIEDCDLTSEQASKIARTLDVPEQDVIMMNRRLLGPDYSLNAPIGPGNDAEWQDWLADEAVNQEQDIADREESAGWKKLLHRMLAKLNERERHILSERRLRDEPTTLKELSKQYRISCERVRQIEARALEKLQKEMRTQVTLRRAAAA